MGMRRGDCPTLYGATPLFGPIRDNISSTLTKRKLGEEQS